MANEKSGSIQYGIDLGTTYSCIARINPGTNLPEVIRDQDAEAETLASAVFFDKSGTQIGDDAKESGASDPKHLCEFFKRYIGRNDLAEADKDKIDGPYYMFDGIDGKTYTPVELSSMILAKLVEYTQRSGNGEVKDVVITCPAYFDNAQREATRRAGEEIGLNVINVVNEPTAAAVNYYHDKLDEEQTILVYDLGGGTFDVTIVHLGRVDGTPTVDVIGTDGDDRLGGKDWDGRLFDIVKKKFEELLEMPISDDSDIAYELRSKIEKAKIDLSRTKGEAKVTTEDGEKITVTRKEFEDRTSDLVKTTSALVDRVLQECDLTPDQLDTVLLVGGSTRMPMIKNELNAKFGADKVILHEPSIAVAKGAAIIASTNYAGNLADTINKKFKVKKTKEGEYEVINPEGKVDQEKTEEVNKQIQEGKLDVVSTKNTDGSEGFELARRAGTGISLLDVVARTFGLVVFDDDENSDIADNVILKGEKAPKKEERHYYTRRDNQRHVDIPVVESMSQDKKDIVKMEIKEDGTPVVSCMDFSKQIKQRNVLSLKLPDGLKKGTQLNVLFSIDGYGNIQISVDEPTTNSHSDIDFKFTNPDD